MSPQTHEPKPFGPVPTFAQLKWAEMEFYGFLHFTTNTFTDREWGQGDEPESVFNPTQFDAEQIVSVAQRAGMKGLILTCKHHDGFCLWPTKTTAHNVSRSPFKRDVVKLVSDACRRAGLGFGVYLSPWDRNHPDYGKPAYVDVYRRQLKELLTSYGDIFEVWHDGANGGDGYYGGAREKRTIDPTSYYGWPETWEMVRELMPMAVIFSDAGPDLRWVGNENGVAGDPCWATYTPHGAKPGGGPAPGATAYQEAEQGHRDGQRWMPAECDVSIRPGWFWHESENSKVKSPAALKELYMKSVGRGASFLLNIPPDRRGQVHQYDAEALAGFKKLIDQAFAVDLARSARVEASNVREGRNYAATNAADGKRHTYWATEDGVKRPKLTLSFRTPVTFNTVRLREEIRLGQRIDAFEIEAEVDGEWKPFCESTSIGNCRIVRGQSMTASKIRLRITDAAACPCLSEFSVFNDPNP